MKRYPYNWQCNNCGSSRLDEDLDTQPLKCPACGGTLVDPYDGVEVEE